MENNTEPTNDVRLNKRMSTEAEKNDFEDLMEQAGKTMAQVIKAMRAQGMSSYRMAIKVNDVKVAGALFTDGTGETSILEEAADKLDEYADREEKESDE